MQYKVDTLAIAQEQEARASVKIAEIEDRCSVHAVSFIKANFNYIKLRARKTEPEISFLIGAAMTKTAVLLGLKGIDKLHQPDILKAIFTHHGDLTLEEIYKAFEFERFNVYEHKTEHFQQFNSDYVTAILKKYRAYKHKIKSEHNIAAGQPDENSLTAEEKEQLVVNAVNRVFEEFKETGTIEGITEYIFDFLVEKGKIKTKGSQALVKYYENKLEEAKDQLKKENEKTESKTPAEKKNLTIDLDRIVSGRSGKILIRAKRNILLEYFKKQTELQTETIF
jgi:hypothetical protein